MLLSDVIRKGCVGQAGSEFQNLVGPTPAHDVAGLVSSARET
jgi:hypothetical protein